jgi:hypothetical protein
LPKLVHRQASDRQTESSDMAFFLLHKQWLQLQSEEIRYAYNWIKQTYIFLIRDKKATRDEDVAGDVLKLLGEDGLTLMTNWSTTYETGEGPRISVKLQWMP